ncbi:MAG: hypothetical protein JSV76_02685, partial [Candidatus Bathyarchaeota archaeon]
KLVKDRKLKLHGLVMTIAVTVHTISILMVMTPSAVTYLVALFNAPLNPLVLTILIHSIAGIFAEVLGVFLVAEWRFRPPPYVVCARRKRVMKPLIALWVFALLSGVIFYAYSYL